MSQSFMDPVWGGDRSVFLSSSPSFGSVLAQPSSSFSPLLFWDWSPSAVLHILVPGVSPENQATWGVNQLPVKQVGLAAGLSEPGSRERLMEPPEGCCKREGRNLYPPSAPAPAGARGRWSEEGCSQHHQGEQYMAYFQCHFVGFASLEGDPLLRHGFVCKLPPPAWRMQTGHPRAGGAQ